MYRIHWIGKIFFLLLAVSPAPAQYLPDVGRDGKVDATDLVLPRNIVAGHITVHRDGGRIATEDLVAGQLRFVPEAPECLIGGPVLCSVSYCRSANRFGVNPGFNFANPGFRLVQTMS